MKILRFMAMFLAILFILKLGGPLYISGFLLKITLRLYEAVLLHVKFHLNIKTNLQRSVSKINLQSSSLLSSFSNKQTVAVAVGWGMWLIASQSNRTDIWPIPSSWFTPNQTKTSSSSSSNNDSSTGSTPCPPF